MRHMQNGMGCLGPQGYVQKLNRLPHSALEILLRGSVMVLQGCRCQTSMRRCWRRCCLPRCCASLSRLSSHWHTPPSWCALYTTPLVLCSFLAVRSLTCNQPFVDNGVRASLLQLFA